MGWLRLKVVSNASWAKSSWKAETNAPSTGPQGKGHSTPLTVASFEEPNNETSGRKEGDRTLAPRITKASVILQVLAMPMHKYIQI